MPGQAGAKRAHLPQSGSPTPPDKSLCTKKLSRTKMQADASNVRCAVQGLRYLKCKKGHRRRVMEVGRRRARVRLLPGRQRHLGLPLSLLPVMIIDTADLYPSDRTIKFVATCVIGYAIGYARRRYNASERNERRVLSCEFPKVSPSLSDISPTSVHETELTVTSSFFSVSVLSGE